METAVAKPDAEAAENEADDAELQEILNARISSKLVGQKVRDNLRLGKFLKMKRFAPLLLGDGMETLQDAKNAIAGAQKLADSTGNEKIQASALAGVAIGVNAYTHLAETLLKIAREADTGSSKPAPEKPPVPSFYLQINNGGTPAASAKTGTIVEIKPEPQK
jgi:hypothetical protein